MEDIFIFKNNLFRDHIFEFDVWHVKGRREKERSAATGGGSHKELSIRDLNQNEKNDTKQQRTVE